MERIAFISGETFIYWNPLILGLAAITAIAFYAALYIKKDGNAVAMSISILLAILFSIPLSRLVHWYCRTAAYPDFHTAMTDYSIGGYALIGVFCGCLLAACLVRLLQITKNLPRMLDCMSIGGGIGIAVGRLASLFGTSDRGMIVSDEIGFPFAYPITNAVSGAVENRLATFMIQSMLVASIVAVLLLYMLWRALRKKSIPDGDICLMFLMMYGACQIVCDSTRYDSLFLRSNGFVSIVQILGLVALVIPIILFSVRPVRNNGLKVWHFLIWIIMLGLMGYAGYMEYYVQRHGSEAVYAYKMMSSCLAVIIIFGLFLRWIGIRKKAKKIKKHRFT